MPTVLIACKVLEKELLHSLTHDTDAPGWNEVDVRINPGRYDRILVVDAGTEPLTDEETLLFFDLVQVPVEIKKIDLSIFRNLLAGLLEPGRGASATA